MKSKSKKVSKRTGSLLSQVMKDETKKAVELIHEIAEEVRKQKEIKLVG